MKVGRVLNISEGDSQMAKVNLLDGKRILLVDDDPEAFASKIVEVMRREKKWYPEINAFDSNLLVEKYRSILRGISK